MDSSSSGSKLVYKMSDEDIKKLIHLRSSNSGLFDGRKNSSKTGWSAIIREMGLEDKMTTEQMAKKWENLKARYKDAKFPPAGMEKNPTCWKWFNLMDDALGEDFDDRIVHQVTTSEDGHNSTAQPGKKLCQVKVEGELLEFLEEERTVSPATDQVKTRSVKKAKQASTQSHSLDVLKTKLHRDRQLLEKEIGGLDREKALLGRERALVDRERAALQRDRSLVEKDKAAVVRDRAAVEMDRTRLEKEREDLARDRATFERERRLLERGMSSSGCNGLVCPPDKYKDRLIYLLERVIEKI